jgi:hypothetical protein
MKAGEIDVEMLVRKTLHFAGPATEEAARRTAEMVFTDQLHLLHFSKWSETYVGGRPVPTGTIVGDGPRPILRGRPL